MKSRYSLFKTGLIILLLLMGSSSVFAQFYSAYSMEKRKSLAEAYYLVGRQFQALGKDNGETYVKLAYLIYPGLDPSLIKDDEDPEKEEDKKTDREKEKTGKLIAFKFNRLVTSFLAKDVEGVSNQVDEVLYNGDYFSYVAERDLKTELAALFTVMKTKGMVPESVFDFSSVRVTPEEPGVYKLTVKATYLDFNAFFPFWKETQTYYWHRDEKGNWLLFGITSIPAYSEYRAHRETLLVEQGIKNAFLSCLKGYYAKDLSLISPFLNDIIDLRKMETQVTRQEVELTFTGFFQEEEIASVADPAALVQSMGVTSAPGEDYDGMVYLLGVQFKDTTDLTFWSAYKSYYFKLIEGVWKVIGID